MPCGGPKAPRRPSVRRNCLPSVAAVSMADSISGRSSAGWYPRNTSVTCISSGRTHRSSPAAFLSTRVWIPTRALSHSSGSWMAAKRRSLSSSSDTALLTPLERPAPELLGLFKGQFADPLQKSLLPEDRIVRSPQHLPVAHYLSDLHEDLWRIQVGRCRGIVVDVLGCGPHLGHCLLYTS